MRKCWSTAQRSSNSLAHAIRKDAPAVLSRCFAANFAEKKVAGMGLVCYTVSKFWS